MKKSFFAFLLIFVLLFCAACNGADPSGESGSGAEDEGGIEKLTGEFRVGFAREDIFPRDSVPLSGYGQTLSRMSDGIQNHIYAQVIALTDPTGETVLLMALDMTGVREEFSKKVLPVLAERIGIAQDHIFMNGSHSHSCPDVMQTSVPAIVAYNETDFPNAVVRAAKAALADRSPATIQTGEAEFEGMNNVRHFVKENGEYYGANYGTTDGITGHVKDPDTQAQFLRFNREGKKDIFILNWQAHPIFYGAENLEVSPDYLGYFRDKVEAEKDDVYAVMLEGAAGNLNGFSYWSEEDTTRDAKMYGEKLASLTIPYMDKLEDMPSGNIHSDQNIIAYPTDKADLSLLSAANEVLAYGQGKWPDRRGEVAEFARSKGLNSYYHASAVISKSKLGPTRDLYLGVFSIGDSIAFASEAGEPFDQEGQYVKENSPFKRTFFLGYGQYHIGYQPSMYAYDVPGGGFYEANTTVFERGTAEKAAEKLVEMLEGLKAQE